MEKLENLLEAFGYLFLTLFNVGGVISWITIYNREIYTEWWVFVAMFFSGAAAIICALRFSKIIRKWIFKTKI